MSVRSILRNVALDRAGYRCEWPPTCDLPGRLEMAHIMPSQMGGNPERDTIANVWMLCPAHHQMFDGSAPIRQREYNLLAQGYIAARFGYAN